MFPNLDLEKRLQALERFMREIHGDRGASNPATWTPTWTGLTVIGTPIYTGVITKIGQLAFFLSQITAGGANTTASTAGSTAITNLPFTVVQHGGLMVSTVESVNNFGVGVIIAATTLAYVPTWAVTNNTIIITGWYEI